MRIYVEQGIYDMLNEKLENMPEKMPGVMKRTTNDTAKGARKRTLREVNGKYLIKKRDFNRTMNIEYATERRLGATLEAKGKPIPLYGFRVKKNQGEEAAKAKVLVASGMKELVLKGGDNGKDLKAFVQKVGAKGHIGVFQRLSSNERGKAQRQYDAEKRKGRKGRDAAALKNLGKSLKKRYIRQLYSLSIPQMVESGRVYPAVREEILFSLRENLEKQIALVMEGAG